LRSERGNEPAATWRHSMRAPSARRRSFASCETAASLLVDAARATGVPVIYLVMGYAPDQSNAGGPDSLNPRKELALCLMRERPELRGKLFTYGTWDFQIVDALTGHPGELVMTKPR
jgi:ureidoacrylate peracid hydrolase